MNVIKVFIIFLSIIVLAGCSSKDSGDLNSGNEIDNSNIEQEKTIQVGDIVEADFTIVTEDGDQVESSYESGQSIEFVVGENRIIGGADEQVIGMKKNETKTIYITSEEAFGEYDESKSAVIESEELEALKQAGIEVREGSFIPTKYGRVEVIGLDGNVAIVDLNNQFAGKDLIFKIEVLDIK